MRLVITHYQLSGAISHRHWLWHAIERISYNIILPIRPLSSIIFYRIQNKLLQAHAIDKLSDPSAGRRLSNGRTR